MTSQTPTWTQFQPDRAPALPTEGGHVVALVSLPGARGDAGADLAVQLARAWSRAGERVVLADLDLASPRLHGLLGMENRDGITDAVAFGASVGRVARAVEDEGFFFIGAGTAVAEPGSFLEHPRWEALCQGFREAGATLVAYVPADGETRAHVVEHATDVVLLGAAEDGLGALEGQVGDRVRAFLGPVAGSEEEEEDQADVGVAANDDEVVSLAALAPDDEVAAEEESAEDFALPEEEEDDDVALAQEEADTGEDDFAFAPEEADTGDDDFAFGVEEDDDDVALAKEESDIVEDGFGLVGEEPEEGPSDADDPFALAEDEDDEEENPFALTGDEDDEEENPFALTEDEDDEEALPAAGREDEEVPAVPGFDPEPDLDAGGDLDVAADPEPDFALEPEEAEPEEEHPPVPLADEILAEAGDAPEPAVQMGEGPAPERPATGGRGARETGGRRTFLLVLLLVVLAGAALAWWLGYVEIPGLTPPGSTSSTQPARSVAPLAAAEPVVETAPAAAWAVQLEAHQDRETAWERVRVLADRAPEHLWTTVPVEVDGTVFHRVVVGAVAREPLAEALRGQVAEELGADPESWVLRATPLAYRLGETARLDDARDRVASFRDQGIPAYVLVVTWSDGSERFRIYAGAFADEAEARGLGTLLAERGLTGYQLTERAGRLPE